MYVYIYIYTLVTAPRTPILRTRALATYKYIETLMNHMMCMHTRIHTCVHTYKNVITFHLLLSTYVLHCIVICVNIQFYIHRIVYIQITIYIYMYIYIYIYVYIYIYSLCPGFTTVTSLPRPMGSKDSVAPNVVTFSSTISACAKARSWERAVGVMAQMRRGLYGGLWK